MYKNGGVIIFHKSSLNLSIEEINGLNRISKEKDIEIAGIEIKINLSIKIKIVTIYRSPSGDTNIFFTSMKELLNNLVNDNSMLVLCGDFNIDFLSKNKVCNQLCDILMSYNVDCLIKEPTRIGINSVSSIDYMCSNFLQNQNNFSCQIFQNGLSDHTAQMLCCDIPTVYQTSNNKVVRLFSGNNYQNFIHHVSRENWLNVYSATTVSEGFKAFTSNFDYYIEISFPFTTVTENCNKKSWITRGIKISCQKLKLLYQIMIQTKTLEDKNYYKSYKRIYDKVIKAAKRLYNDSIYSNASNKSKAAWSIINKNLGTHKNKSNKINEIKINDETINNLQDIVRTFNNYYVNLPISLANKFNDVNLNNIGINKSYPTIFVEPVRENEIFNIIMQMKKSNSSGIDKISINMLKSVVNYIVEPLTFLINWSLSEGVFPEEFKIAKIVPLYKKGQRECIENYRPISLLSCVSKILERLVFNRMYKFCIDKKILCDEQHGFRKGRSTQSAILGFLNELYDSLNNNNKCLGVFMDLSKAFDLVDHALLLEKLSKYGFRGKLGDWLSSYLSNRKQLVEINGVKSEKLCISSGVPQGSVLGPLLFILFVNDLPDIVNESSLYMFADDNSLLNSNVHLQDLIYDTQIKLDLFVSKFQNDKLLLNEDKTVFIKFTPRVSNCKESHLLRVKGKSLQQVSSTKFLGIYIDNALNWETHISELCKKLSTICFTLYRLKNITNRNTLLSYYYANFFSRVQYGIIFWGCSYHTERIFKLQKHAIRNIVGISRRISCRCYFKELQILPIACLYIWEIILFARSNLNNFLPNNFNHSYDTRAQNNLVIPIHNLSIYEKSPKYMAITLYNKLPNNIRQISNLNNFKSSLRTFLLDNMFYSVEEFLQYIF